MKTRDENQNAHWPSPELLDQLRRRLHAKISHEELEYSFRLEAFDRLIDLLRMDPAVFYRLWVQPLLEAGVTAQVAFACIAESYFSPN